MAVLMALSDEDAVVRVAAAAHGLTRVSRTCICAAACSQSVVLKQAERVLQRALIEADLATLLQ